MASHGSHPQPTTLMEESGTLLSISQLSLSSGPRTISAFFLQSPIRDYIKTAQTSELTSWLITSLRSQRHGMISAFLQSSI
jgi:hypothetical protein